MPAPASGIGRDAWYEFPRRRCGAAALVEVLRTRGLNEPLAKVWPRVSSPDPFGTVAARSYLLAAHARRLGFEAAVIQCREPRAWEALRRCDSEQLSVILNHRADDRSGEGHYTRLLSADTGTLTLHDPITRDRTTLPRETFLGRWRGNLETPGHVLIAIGERLSKTEFEAGPRCPRCLRPLECSPRWLFRTLDWEPGGLWRRLFCLGCDAGLQFCNTIPRRRSRSFLSASV